MSTPDEPRETEQPQQTETGDYEDYTAEEQTEPGDETRAPDEHGGEE